MVSEVFSVVEKEWDRLVNVLVEFECERKVVVEFVEVLLVSE